MMKEITCIVCGSKRMVRPQNVKIITRCDLCQLKFDRAKQLEYQRNWRAKKKKLSASSNLGALPPGSEESGNSSARPDMPLL